MDMIGVVAGLAIGIGVAAFGISLMAMQVSVKSLRANITPKSRARVPGAIQDRSCQIQVSV